MVPQRKSEGWVSSWAYPHVEEREPLPWDEPRERMPDPTEMLRYRTLAFRNFYRFLATLALSLVPHLGFMLWVGVAFGGAWIYCIWKFGTVEL